MNLSERFLSLGEYAAAGMYEDETRGIFYRKALGISRYFEHCALAEYRGEYLYPSGVLPVNMRIRPTYMFGLDLAGEDYNTLAAEDPELTELFMEEIHRYRPSVPPEHAVAGNMYTHSMPNYERILKEGFASYSDRIARIEDRDMREGLQQLLSGIRTYVSRCVDYLETVDARPELISALKKVPFEPAETLYEALVGWNFVLYLDNCDNLGCVASGLMPYYAGEDVVEVLKNLYDNLDQNNGYSMALGMDYSPLTLQCLEASKGKRRPMIELFVDEQTPDSIWQKAFEVIRTTNGQPAFYNPRILLDGLKKKFPQITDEDLKKFCGGGCTESMLAGLSDVESLGAGINLHLILEQVMQKWLETADTFDVFYERYLSEVRSVVEQVTLEMNHSQQERAKYNPLPMRTLLVDDCIDRGLDFHNRGARYRWSIINFAGLINVIDSMLVIRDLVFREQAYSASQLLALLAEEDPVFLQQARNHPVCYGRGDPDADRFAHQISSDVFSMLDDKVPYNGGGFLPASIQFQSQVEAGRRIGATPDGRTAGAPLCDSLGAIFGKDTKGPTALLNSVTSLDLKRALGVPVLNFNLDPKLSNDVLKALILSYLQMGGAQMQITCISRAALEAAYENPELYPNLVVRVGGYSEYFTRLTDELKRMVIARTIQT